MTAVLLCGQNSNLILSNISEASVSSRLLQPQKSTIIDIDFARQQHQSSPHEPQSRTNLPLHLTLAASVHDDPPLDLTLAPSP
ncbi:hypothetical protein DPMN_151574 [Dreissena polymorpha]|uniref:Uncharacterized protein n=1 Tax=Dreissena polymorpha TaxID=45954 RepID=A0A9D4FHX2_DREPO|nr:hypothetical protein DPMN_151574 [Dreissena polymorpha]